MKLIPKSEVQKKITALQKTRLLVIGDVGIDRYTEGLVERISPEAPVPIVHVQKETLKLGLAANVSDNLSSLGIRSSLIGVIGKDATGKALCDILHKIKVKSNGLLEDARRPTTLKDRIVSDKQQLLRIDYESVIGLTERHERKVLASVQKALTSPRAVDAIILQDYSKGFFSEFLIQSILLEAKDKKVWVGVDPNPKSKLEWYKGASFMTPNLKEAQALSGMMATDQKSLQKLGFFLLEKIEARYMLITLGKDGVALFNRDADAMTVIPTFAREVYDVSGAGDTVISVVTAALAAKMSLEEAAVLANIAAGVVVGKRGTATVTPEELVAFLSE